MDSQLIFLGDPPFTRDANGKLKSRIGTLFPYHNTLVTLPLIHVMQRQAFLNYLNQERQAQGLPLLTRAEEGAEGSAGVDLIIDDKTILIRPDPDRMELAFEADQVLQELIPKHRIKFLGVLNDQIREAIAKRGEWWRITPLPKSAEELKRLIGDSKMSFGSEEVYYSHTTGIRYLTCQQFENLGRLDDEGLRNVLQEIQKFSAQTNAHGYPELTFFATDRTFPQNQLAPYDFIHLNGPQIRALFAQLGERFHRAVPLELRQDDLENAAWRNNLVAALIGQDERVISEETLLGLSPEYFMQIEWLPGGRVEDGELIFDSILEETPADDDDELKRLQDEKPQKFIYNSVREYGDLEYVNIGCVVASLSSRPALAGRRGVYVAVLKLRGRDKEIVSVIRMQKRGVREYLEAGCPLLEAMLRSEEYTEYILDRRLGCRQLGMNVPMRHTAKRISEWFVPREGPAFAIWSPYFERDYIRGLATDKLPPYRFAQEEFACRFARLLGRAAASNLIVGRGDVGGQALFDDGDEVLIEDVRGMPVDIVVADHTGAFNDYLSELGHLAVDYAEPINRRWNYLPNPRSFADLYLDEFVERFARIQEEYRRRHKAFDKLFQHRLGDEAKRFALRWEKVLARMEEADPGEMARVIRDNLTHL